MLFHRVLLGIDGAVALIVVWFFLVGLADGSVSSFNAGHWLGILAALAAILGGAIALRRNGHGAAASALFLVLAVSALLYASVILLLMAVSGARWQ